MTTRKKKAPAPPRPWPASAVETWPIDRIKPYPKNARMHAGSQVEQIAASMERFGVTTPLLVDEAGVLIYGHGRRMAAELLVKRGKAEYGQLPVVVARGWTEDEKKAYRLADNQLALTSEWDLPVLKAEIGSLAAAGFELPLLGFPDAKLVQFTATPKAPDQLEPSTPAPDQTTCPKCGHQWSKEEPK